MKKRIPYSFVAAALLLVISSVFSAVMLEEYSTRRFILAVVPAVVFSAVLIAEIIMAQRNSIKFIAKLNESVGVAENEIMYYSETPAVIVDEDYVVLWCNREFSSQLIDDHEIFGTDIARALDLDIKELFTDRITKTEYNGKLYKVSSIPVEKNDTKLIYISFTDISEFAELFSKYKRTRPSVILLVIDNYEDVLQNFKESEKAQVAASTETLLEEFMSRTTGVLRKLSHDKFIAVIEEQHLCEIINSKFEILDNARNITVGDRSNIITLSIGVGRGASTLEESESFAKQALDMCLGRGGDQAAVKTENGFKFYGGVAKGVEKKSKAKSRIISNAVQEVIHNSSEVFIMGHRFADLDAVGSGTGLAGAIRMIGEEAYYVVDFEKNLSHSLVSSIQKEYDDLIISPEEAEQRFSDNSLLIIVDTHNANLVESRKLYEMAGQKIVIDHHRKSVNFIDDAVIFYHEPYASSASEMVSEMIQYFKNVNLVPQVLAEALLAGITLDTKNFVMKTGVRTFEAAAYLRKCGADTIKVKGFFTSSIEDYRKRSELISDAEIIGSCAIAVARMQSDDIRIIAPQAADELLSIENVDASFVIYKTGNVTNISARSLGILNVQVIMEKLGGGGHQTMAAVQLENTSFDEAKKMLIEAIKSD
ncbi:MAG: DHH family phosphoesterase [Oscillospiraceae bacterium]